MSGSTSVLQEFLVALGFKVDEAGLKKFGQYLAASGARVTAMAVAVEAAQSAILAFTKETTAQLEFLYFTAQRSGTTVANLKAIQYGLTQVGLGSQTAAQALQALAMGLRFDPGKEPLLRYLGVQTRDAAGHLRDTSKIFDDLVTRLAEMPPYIAKTYAEMLGIDQQTLYVLLTNREEAAAAKARWEALAVALGVNLDRAAESAHRFQNAFRETEAIVELLIDKIGAKLADGLRPKIEEFNAWVVAHSKDIEKALTSVTDEILEVADDFLTVYKAIDKVVSKTVGWKDTLEVIAGIIVGRIFGPIGLVIYAIEVLKDKLNALRERTEERESSGQVAPLERQDRLRTLEELKKLPGDIARALRNLFTGERTPTAQPSSGTEFDPSMVHRADFGRPAPDDGSGVTPLSAPVATHAGTPVGAPLAPDIEAEVRRQARYRGLDEEHMIRLARVEQGGYDRVSPAGAVGPMQLMPRTAAELGVDPRNWVENIRGGVEYFARQLRRFGSYAAADAAYNAGPERLSVDRYAHTGNLGYLPFETQRYVLGINSGREGMRQAPIINQRTDIHVHGADPRATGAEVEHRQNRVNAGLVRDFRTAVLA